MKKKPTPNTPPASFTPGPWKIVTPDHPHLKTLRKIMTANGLVRIGEVATTVNDGVFGVKPYPQGEANAHLISAAPDLLEALKACHANYEIGKLHNPKMCGTCKLILKAEGRKS